MSSRETLGVAQDQTLFGSTTKAWAVQPPSPLAQWPGQHSTKDVRRGVLLCWCTTELYSVDSWRPGVLAYSCWFIGDSRHLRESSSETLHTRWLETCPMFRPGRTAEPKMLKTRWDAWSSPGKETTNMQTHTCSHMHAYARAYLH